MDTHSNKQADTQRHTGSNVQLCPILNNLSSYGSCREGSGKNVPPFVFNNKRTEKHCYATVGHFVNCRDDSVAVKCQTKYRTRKEKDKPRKEANVGSELLQPEWISSSINRCDRADEETKEK